MKGNYDFSGWATRNDLKCSDGRTIRHNAFKDCDGIEVPLVWNHSHNDPENVLGKALLQHRDEGVYCYGTFNDTTTGQVAKTLVQHGDIKALSIYANQLKQIATDVVHGMICEVSLVHKGANPGAYIDTVIAHSDEADEEAIIYTGEPLFLCHSDEEPEKKEPENDAKEEKKMANNEKTVQDVIDEMTEEQKNVMYALIGAALEEKGAAKEEEDAEMKHNVFDNDEMNDDALCHAAMATIIGDGKRCGSLKESFMAHAADYGIESIDFLMPDAKTIGTDAPSFIKRTPDAWVGVVMNGVHKTPFSRIKSVFADITEDEARARGYMKGKYKKEEVFSLLKRTTTPTTIYKKQKMDRDDVIDITDFDVVTWIKAEMRLMLDEEIARAILFGDGRLASSDDKISEQNIRPVISDEDLYTLKKTVTPAAGESLSHAIINAAVEVQDDYQGSGTITAFMQSSVVTQMLLLEDKDGHRMYKNAADVAAAMNVDRVVKVAKGIIPAGIYCVALDLKDYNLGADKGGAINMFDDFDIDYNQMKYLIETRASGALIKPYSAFVLKNA